MRHFEFNSLSKGQTTAQVSSTVRADMQRAAAQEGLWQGIGAALKN
ncbi:MAG: hypothetical protein ACLTSM_06845 [Eubacterium sp.]